ncbi:hypothetical protein ONZ43_g6234 [Nemania bipapillata]|uniref:Uncharacterized protein n=1 Tax=Nemania bipapillata TaxID=110536 RepID=A0ACC2I169_9PEZI|nr:hypothetical protein ONZ43_g6234 [Nemania bipapillata]
MSFDFPPTTAHTAAAIPNRPRQQLGSAVRHSAPSSGSLSQSFPSAFPSLSQPLFPQLIGSPSAFSLFSVPFSSELELSRTVESIYRLPDEAVLEARLSEKEKGPCADPDDHETLDQDQQSSDGGSVPQMSPACLKDAASNFSNISDWLMPINTQLLPTNPSDGADEALPGLTFPIPERISIGTFLNPLVCSDLDQLYFDRVHTFAPLLQKNRYLSWSRDVEKPIQKACLQYAMWTVAASLSSQFQTIRHELYTEARHRLDALEIETQDVSAKFIEQPQAWLLLSMYELVSDRFQRGLISAGRAFRLVQLMRLHEVDRHPQMTFQGAWVDQEVMRRTFWVAYGLDRFTSLVDGLPLSFDEREVRLPTIYLYPLSIYLSIK